MSDILESISAFVANPLIYAIIVFLIVPALMRYYENHYFSEIAQKKSIWINFIQKNQHIQKCISNYSDLEKKADLIDKFSYFVMFKSIILLIILILVSATFSTLLNKYVLIQLHDNPSNSNSILSILFIFVSLFLLHRLKINNEKSMKINETDIISNYPTIQKEYNAIIIYSAIFAYFGTPFFLQNWSYIFLTSILTNSIVVYSALHWKQKYAMKAKNTVNNSFKRNFPELEISTIGAEKLSGQLKNVFDHDSITLINNDIETKILWSAVASLKETKTRYKESQKSLDDFFR
jgi:hypothetical protein